MKTDSELYNYYASGTKVRLDKGFRNSSIVTIVKQTPQRMFSTVTVDGDATW